MLEKDWHETHDELMRYKKVRADVIDANKQHERKIEETDTRVRDLEKQVIEVQARLCTEVDLQNAFKNSYEQLVKSLKHHDYGSCECKLKLIPQVMKAEEYILPLKLGKKTPGKVEKLMHNQRDQKQELERKDALIKDLEGRLDQLEKKES